MKITRSFIHGSQLIKAGEIDDALYSKEELELFKELGVVEVELTTKEAKEAVEVPDEAGQKEIDLSALSFNALVKMCKEKKIKLSGREKKADLIIKLTEAVEQE